MPTETKQLNPRPPIVAVLGHVDHGKTTLLDNIRKSNVAAREAGGITQSIGAYEIEHNGKKITFIDTPGHEAFTNMRSRGCSVADLAILVVAADESLKPQTHESIKILHESTTPFVVAITKIDKPGADVERVKTDLTSAHVLLEGHGGQISFQPISAKSGDHVDELLDLILLAAEVEGLTYDSAAPASGFILESKMDRRRGLEASVVVKNGVLKHGDAICTASASGKIKILEDFLGKPTKMLEPSAPALVIGFEKLPGVGERFTVGEQESSVEQASATTGAAAPPAVTESENTTNFIIKAIDAGSLEAFADIICNLPSENPVKLVHVAVGDVVDNDVKLAISTGSVILAFGNRIEKGAAIHAEANRVHIVSSKIIYELIRSAEELIASGAKPKPIGILEVLAVFNQTKLDKQVVGGRVTEGTVKNRTLFEIERGEEIVGHGRTTNLQQQKKDASQATTGEAGLMISSATAIEKGDKLVFRA